MKKSVSQTPKQILNQDKEKKARTQIVKPKMFDLSSKMLSRYQTNILLRG